MNQHPLTHSHTLTHLFKRLSTTCCEEIINNSICLIVDFVFALGLHSNIMLVSSIYCVNHMEW